MGLLELIGFGPKLQRLQKKMMEKFGPPENRQGAIEELGEMRSEEAVSALLMRYTFRVDPGITDDDEKARVLALIVQTGQTALPAVKKFIRERDEISWPLRALSDLLPEGEGGGEPHGPLSTRPAARVRAGRSTGSPWSGPRTSDGTGVSPW